jgi:hypothetical protein
MIPAEAGTAQWEQEGETDRPRSPSCGSLVVGEPEPPHHQAFSEKTPKKGGTDDGPNADGITHPPHDSPEARVRPVVGRQPQPMTRPTPDPRPRPHGKQDPGAPGAGPALFRGPELSPAGAERDRCIPCTGCRRPTWNYSAVCWPCIDERGNR